jgi:ribosomal protein L13
MLPKTRLAKRMIRGLRIYPEDKYEQIAQQPIKLEV